MERESGVCRPGIRLGTGDTKWVQILSFEYSGCATLGKSLWELLLWNSVASSVKWGG